MTIANRRINMMGAFTGETAMTELSEWRSAAVAFVENTEGTVYLAVQTERETTYYPLAPTRGLGLGIG